MSQSKHNGKQQAPAEPLEMATALDDRKRQRILEIQAAEASFRELLAYLAPNGSPSRELNLAKTKLEEAAMWAIKGVVAQ